MDGVSRREAFCRIGVLDRTRRPAPTRVGWHVAGGAVLLAALAVSVGCSRGPEERQLPAPDARPAAAEQPPVTNQVGDGQVAAALDPYVRPQVAAKLDVLLGDVTGPIHYFAQQVDLDADGRPELIVHSAGPMVCGTGGCNTVVLAQDGGSLREVATITVTRPPIIVAESSSNGWRDLLVSVSGGGIPAHMARLRFDGSSYPGNPTVEPAEALQQQVAGETLIPAFESFTEGVLLRPAPE